MRANESRRVKITYLVPTLWLADETITTLPFEWLDASLNPVEAADLLAWPENGWEDPVMTEAPDLPLVGNNDPEFGPFHHVVMDRELIESLESISYTSPMKNGIFMSTYDLGGSGWYQLAYLPSVSLEIGGTKKAMVLVDHDASKTSLTGMALIERARASLKSSLTPADSFNVVVSRLDVDPVSANWLPATPETIDAVFDEIAANTTSLYSNLPSLLASGITFIADNGNNGEVLLISSGDAIADVTAADQLVEDLQAVTSPLPPVHIADVANRNVTLNVDAAGVFEGNEYLYSQLAEVSGGRFLNIRTGRSYDNIVRDLLSSLGETILNPDLFATSTGGFTFGRFTSVSDSDAAPTSKAITQIGNFLGFSPFSIEASGTYRGSLSPIKFNLEIQTYLRLTSPWRLSGPVSKSVSLSCWSRMKIGLQKLSSSVLVPGFFLFIQHIWLWSRVYGGPNLVLHVKMKRRLFRSKMSRSPRVQNWSLKHIRIRFLSA